MIAVRDWPGQIFFSGLGDHIHTGSRLPETPAANPVRRIYKLYLGEKKTRPRWDHIGVLFAIRRTAEFWRVHTSGHNHISEIGTNQWREGPETNHRLVKLQPSVEKALVKTLDESMVEAPSTQ